MAERKPAPADCVAALRAETIGYHALLEVLEAECRALCAADGDALQALTPAKLDHVAKLQSLAGARSDWLAASGCSDVESALDATFDRPPERQAARAEWDTLLVLARQARRLNDVNGRLVARQRQHFAAALAALLQAAGSPPVYGADGRPQHGNVARTLAAI
jgi:flagella synthesis protein FlgN